MLKQARATVMKQTGGHYPAPLEILRVIGATYGMRLQDGFKVERKAVAKLLFTPESVNLRRIFTMSEDAKRVPSAAAALPVDSVAVLGAGTMGGEIAYLFSRAGIRVRLRDIKPEPILTSLDHARSLFDPGDLVQEALMKAFEVRYNQWVVGAPRFQSWNPVRARSASPAIPMDSCERRRLTIPETSRVRGIEFTPSFTKFSS